MNTTLKKKLIKYGGGIFALFLVLLLISFGTISPCGIGKKMMISRMTDVMASEKKDDNPFSGLAMVVGMNMANQVFDSISPPRCIYADVRMAFGESPGIDPSKVDKVSDSAEKEKPKNTDASKAILAKVTILKSHFYVDHSNEFMPQPIIAMTIKNETPVAISRIYFNSTLTSPGRSVPWVKTDFNHEIAGGLEPGETANWKLATNAFGEWREAVNAPKDAILTLEVTRIEGTEGKPIADISGE